MQLYLQFPNTSPWRDVHLKHRDNFKYTSQNSVVYKANQQEDFTLPSREVIVLCTSLPYGRPFQKIVKDILMRSIFNALLTSTIKA
jgi:hypothetical protein